MRTRSEKRMMSSINGRHLTRASAASTSTTCCSSSSSSSSAAAAPSPPVSPSPSCSSALLTTKNKYDDDDENAGNCSARKRHRSSATVLDKTPPATAGTRHYSNVVTAASVTGTATANRACCQANHARHYLGRRVCHTRALSAPDSASSLNQRASERHRLPLSSLLCAGVEVVVAQSGRGGRTDTGSFENNNVGDQRHQCRYRRWPTKISQRRQPAGGVRTRTWLTRAACSGSGKSELGVNSLATALIILAHICPISQPAQSTSGLVVSAALAQAVDASAPGADSAHLPLVAGDDQSVTSNQGRASTAALTAQAEESWRAKPESMRDLRDARLADKLMVNMSNVFEVLLKKKPYSKYWTVEQKWDDLFTRGMAVQGTMRQMMMKNFLRDIEYYADVTISAQCERDLKYLQNYVRHSTNMRWLAHMFDSTGKSEPGMLTGQLAHLGHPVQCIRVRAPARPSNESFDERFFEEQTRVLGERFRGKYCVASVRPVMPAKPAGVVVSRFSDILNSALLSNISYTGEPPARLKQRARQMSVFESIHSTIDREHLRLDQVPFESELYQYLIAQRNFMFSLPRFMGVCYPSSCTRDDIRMSLQKSMDDQHQVVDIEFECEQEETNAWDWFITPRLMSYVLLTLVASMVFLVSFTRYILLSKLQIRRSKLAPDSKMANLLNALDMFSMDKCAGILFVKTKRASPFVDWTKVENNRSTTIDALKGLLILALVYSQMTILGALPLPFMWSKWSDAMFPFFRSLVTQVFINLSIWSEAFYMISAYLIALKILENYRPKFVARSNELGGLGNNHLVSLGGTKKGAALSSRATGGSGGGGGGGGSCPLPDFFSFAIKRYVRLALPMLAFMLLNYVWPRLSNGFVMQDQAAKLMVPCDTLGWTNFLMFHNYAQLNETCLWPSHASASFFQLHLLSYPILVLCIMALYSQFNLDDGRDYDENKRHRRATVRVLTGLAFGAMGSLALFGAIYPALQASKRSLIVPFLIDYIDFDNYARVLEWTVLPTYNHLTSYMFGLALAFIVIRRKACEELRRLEASTSEWHHGGSGAGTGQYSQREGSIESVRSSSTQELHSREVPDCQLYRQPPFVTTNAVGASQQVKHFNLSSGESSMCDASSERGEDNDDASLSHTEGSGAWRFAKSLSCVLVCIGALLASWFWNGLGQPMSDGQTFWYVILTKLAFCASFAYLFHAHFATRRNSSNPWIITRFLVPIGRMSLTVFYTSWLVIWFDILSSLYQWHPSHYFICEKYNEIIFITLIVAMFVYGAFEGIVKRIQCSSRLANVKHDIRLRMSLATSGAAAAAAAGNNIDVGHPTRALRQRFKVKPFESFFDPQDKPSWEELASEYQLDRAGHGIATGGEKEHTSGGGGDEQRSHSTSVNVIGENQQQQRLASVQSAHGERSSGYLTPGGNGAGLTPASTTCNLSPSDRYKLNAELRANYSFASIGLYEYAGATGDLSHLNTNDPQDQKR